MSIGLKIGISLRTHLRGTTAGVGFIAAESALTISSVLTFA